MLTENELTHVIDSTCENYWESRVSLGHFETPWSEMDVMEKNGVRETVLPFVFHSLPALEEVGVRKLRKITVPEELNELADGDTVVDALSAVVLKTAKGWLAVDQFGAELALVALPAYVVRESPKA